MKITDPLILSGDKSTVRIPNRVFLAPMAGVTDLPLRLLCHEQGAGLVAGEMVSAKAITYRNRGTANLLETHPDEHPVSMQLFGHEPDVLAEALDRIGDGRISQQEDNDGNRTRHFDFDVLDINMGCPVPKITGNGEGSALMKNPRLIEQFVRAAVQHTPQPVTVKIRLGYDEEHRNAVECALAAEAGGASAVAVHGRTRTQMYSGEADLAGIAAVKRAVKIPVFGNGDVHDGASALRMFRETGCDAVLIGRAARGNPWIFGDIRKELEGVELASTGTGDTDTAGTDTVETDFAPVPKRTAADLRGMILRHADLMLQYKPAAIAMREMRKHVAWYIAGFPGAAKIRSEVCQVETREELEKLLDRFM